MNLWLSWLTASLAARYGHVIMSRAIESMQKCHVRLPKVAFRRKDVSFFSSFFPAGRTGDVTAVL